MATATLKKQWQQVVDRSTGSDSNNSDRYNRLSADLTDWAKPLLLPYRYKCLWGGRGCISGDTLIETPSGLIRVDKFSGGEVYVHDRGKKIVGIAGTPVKYSPEPLYKVTFSNGVSLKVTTKHRFLTNQGWLEYGKILDASDSSELRFVCHSQTRSSSAQELSSCFSHPQLSVDDLQGLYSSASLSMWLEDALHCWRKLLGFLYCCSEYCRQYGLLPHSVPSTYQDVLRQLSDELQHTNHTSIHTDALEFSYTNNLLQFLPHLSSLFARIAEEVQNCEEMGSCSDEISSVLLLVSSLLSQLSHKKNNPLSLIQELSKQSLALSSVTGQDKNLQTISDTLFFDVDDKSYSNNLAGCNLSHHYNELKLESVKYHGVESFYDFFVPFFNNYLTEGGIVNHNSGKSWGVADALLLIGLTRKIRVLCAREFQISIKDSVHHLLKERIEVLGLEDFYTVQETTIFGQNNSTFIFKGIRHNVQSIKSMSGLTHCWIEEAQTISAESWQVLVPTIREEESEIWVTFNPHRRTDVVYQELVEKERANAYVERVNWDRNPHFPAVLDEERRSMQATDPDAYHHIWEGGFWEQSEAQILHGKWIIDEFEPVRDWDGPYVGADFGFASSPTALIKCWVYNKRLYVERESYAVGLELDHTAERWKLDVPGCEAYNIRSDSARPESISYLRRHGIPRIIGVEKWKGSVEDGIAHLRSYEKIVIHPRCKHTIEEARLYSYKVDRLTGDILPVVVDAQNHAIDGLRYALAPLIQNRGRGMWGQSQASYS